MWQIVPGTPGMYCIVAGNSKTDKLLKIVSKVKSAASDTDTAPVAFALAMAHGNGEILIGTLP